MTKNLQLWNRVKYTDPSRTKQAQLPGGFKATAVDANWLLQRATELFGPAGVGFGWTILFPPAMTGNLATVCLRFWYVVDGERGEFDVVASNDSELRRKDSSQPDSDAFKKALTDAIKLALTKLGFLADIHQGMHDDPEYVAWLQSDAGQRRLAQGDPAPAAPPADPATPLPAQPSAAPPKQPPAAAQLTPDQVANALFYKLKARDPAAAQSAVAANTDPHAQADALARALCRLLQTELKARDAAKASEVAAGLPRRADGKVADPVAAVAALEAALAPTGPAAGGKP